MINRFEGVNAKKIEEIINSNMLIYSGYTIKHRALPAVEDGLKPVYRRILETMNRVKAVNFTKSQKIEGQVMEVHPHAGCYPTIVGLTQKDGNLIPLIEGKGNFGQHTSRDLSPGAPRYTEVKMSEMAKDIFKDLNKDIVNWIPNYDGTLMTPEYLPVKFPLILAMAQEGISVGMGNKMASFNINDICDTTINYLKTGSFIDIVPDFATGGNIIRDELVFKRINSEGKGSIKIRAKAEIDKDSILVTEIPYSTTREKIIEEIIDIIKEKKIQNIKEVLDLTGLDGLKIKIVCNRNSDMKTILEQLYKKTRLQDTYSCNFNVLVNGLPKVLGVHDIIKEWLAFREKCLIGLKSGEINKFKRELHLLEGFEKIVNSIDKLIDIIRFSPNPVEYMIKEWDLSVEQAEYIVGMSLRNLSISGIEKKLVKKHEIEVEIAALEEFVKEDLVRKQLIIKELEEIKVKFGQERKSKIINVENIIIKEVKVVDDVVVCITKNGFIKKLRNANGVQKLKPGDEIRHTFETKSDAEIIVFAGVDAFKIYIDDMEYCKNSDFGNYVPRVINSNEDIKGYSIIDEKYKFNIIRYDNNKIAKVSLDGFATVTKRKKLSNALYSGANVLDIIPVKNETILAATSIRGVVKEIKLSDMITKTTKNTAGVGLGIKIKEIDVK